MLNHEEYMQVRILFKQGNSIREISRIMQISRNTVHRYLKEEQKPSYKARDICGTDKIIKENKYIA
jgi:DNA invertase Pin-like site-specific DNA recombinase